MEALQITKENALKAYQAGNSDVKAVLSNLFGMESFIPKNITDRIKTYEDACEALGLDPDDELPYEEPEGDEVSINAYKKLTIIARVLNQGWKPDWSNTSQYKYLPWFTHKSGFGLSYGDFGHWCTGAAVGSRLCYQTKELAQYAGKQFEDIYRDYLTLQ